MQLEDYFDFEKFETPYGPLERIRIKGHRVASEAEDCRDRIEYIPWPMLP